MLNVDFTFLWTAFNLLVLYLILNHFLFKRVAKHMAERANAIRENMEKGEAMKAEGEGYRYEQEAIRDSAASERKRIISDACEKAQKEADLILASARKEASALLSSAHEEIEREKERSLNELRSEVVSLALAAAAKVIESSMDTERNRKLINEFLDKEGVA